MIYVETKGDLNRFRLEETLKQRMIEPNTVAELAVTNSFGMPSSDPIYLLADIEKANKALSSGQVMIVSVVGTQRAGSDFVEDFARAAALAKNAGAKIIEANFSCPNVCTCEGSIYHNPETVYTISARLVREIGNIPLIIKVGYFTDPNSMRSTMIAAARAGVRGFCGINTIGMKVVNDLGESALGAGRIKSGVCGSPIRSSALEFMRYARTINDSEKLGLTLIGVGGAILPEHFDEFINAGANIVMSATGMMWDPYLAMRYHKN
jgi:dihydroorotate dehydrogenase